MSKPVEKRPIIIVKKKGGHPHHGGAWKVAYADFVTAMMALFIVLWLLSSADANTRHEIARYFREPGLLKGGRSLLSSQEAGKPMVVPLPAPPAPSTFDGHQAEEQALQHEAQALRVELDRAAAEDPQLVDIRKQVTVQVTPEGLVIELIDRAGDRNLLFDVSSSELKPALQRLLKRFAVTLGRIDNPLLIGGHTDARTFPSSSGRSNWSLSFERADNARRVLEGAGLQGRIQRVEAFADSNLMVKSDPLAAQNRRLSILAVRAR